MVLKTRLSIACLIVDKGISHNLPNAHFIYSLKLRLNHRKLIACKLFY